MAYETLHERLVGPIAKKLSTELKIDNVHALPKIEKVVVNVGINKSKMDSKEMQAYILETLALITGQQPVHTRAKKAISNFKIRQDMVIGAMVTLRGPAMEAFLDRLISYALPRIRDFRGLSAKLDGHGNYAIGLKDHTIFPEVPLVDARQIFGLQIQITTTTDSDEEARLLLKEIGMPFKPQPKKEEVKEEKVEAPAPEAKKEEVKEDLPAGEAGKTEEPAAEEPAQEEAPAEEAAPEAPAQEAAADDSAEAEAETDSNSKS